MFQFPSFVSVCVQSTETIILLEECEVKEYRKISQLVYTADGTYTTKAFNIQIYFCTTTVTFTDLFIQFFGQFRLLIHFILEHSMNNTSDDYFILVEIPKKFDLWQDGDR